MIRGVVSPGLVHRRTADRDTAARWAGLVVTWVPAIDARPATTYDERLAWWMNSGFGVFLGLDVGKSEHHAVGLDSAGKRLHDGPLPNNEPKLRALFDNLAAYGPLLVVVDQPATIGALPVAVARACGHQVAYLPGLAMRRIADLYPGRAKTDAIGDASGFASSAHLAAYAGIAPVTRSSGSSIEGEHPARTGNRKLKRAFFLAAFAALQDPTSRAYYDRKRAEGKKHNAALICLARRRYDVQFAMLKNKKLYRAPADTPKSEAA